MDPTNSNQNQIPNGVSSSSNKSAFLTFLSFLILVSIVGVTIYLYINNQKSKQNNPNLKENGSTQINSSNPAPTVSTSSKSIEPTIKAKLQKYGAVCIRFTDIDEAINSFEVACVLDLSGQGISTLPNDIIKLTSLNEIILSNNKFSEFPKVLLDMPSLVSINLSDNNITDIPGLESLVNLQSLTLSGNPIAPDPSSPTSTESGDKPSGKVKIIY